ncbi:nucleotidyltransferase [Pedobacter antarcticus 4BY]|uniref:Nucleotidyltransferase n=2 Tax=Pedobacter antarcticus TaxID=34086 RepID=A0A081PDN9_9SPHI|nr:sugar phosphate nucleotidyltransferase [Pedobacter antarcticus]KEQ28812.1 nucleotidyltransferase [Pedobacter antarcticus 4BY]SFF13421.1 Nucleotidyl transferase [Pedobacter antarcticus]
MALKKPSLVILAAGMASRYGGNKQTESFGPSGETIMEYSIYDAIKAGFGKVIFIIREEFAEAFKGVIEPKLKGRIETEYVYQSLEKYSGGRAIPAERVKPFGTSHALLCCKEILDAPFAVINADDFYGFDAFEKAADFLNTAVSNGVYACLGYELKNTLSDNGSVTRGEIHVNAAGEMTGITERREIYKREGKAFTKTPEGDVELPLDTKVSMNFFCFTPDFVNWSALEYEKFLDKNLNELKAEFLIPEVSDELIKSGNGVVKMIPTQAIWFGVTFKEDAPVVKAALQELTDKGLYPQNLWI